MVGVYSSKVVRLTRSWLLTFDCAGLTRFRNIVCEWPGFGQKLVPKCVTINRRAGPRPQTFDCSGAPDCAHCAGLTSFTFMARPRIGVQNGSKSLKREDLHLPEVLRQWLKAGFVDKEATLSFVTRGLTPSAGSARFGRCRIP